MWTNKEKATISLIPESQTLLSNGGVENVLGLHIVVLQLICPVVRHCSGFPVEKILNSELH